MNYESDEKNKSGPMLHVALSLVTLSPPICAAKENYNRLPLLSTKEDYEVLLICLLSMLVNST